MSGNDPTRILLETEQFDDLGGWVLDTQFAHEMGSAYLLAHGLGTPVADAATSFDVADAASYRLFVRTKDWVPEGLPLAEKHPGTFRVLLDGRPLDPVLGTDGKDWHWADLNEHHLKAGRHTLALHDLTGFEGRCDAIYLTAGNDVPPADVGPDMLAWRKRLLGIPEQPADNDRYDVIVVGGGCPGSSAAYVAAQQGARTLLIQNRPVLGGNASNEIGLEPRGEITPYTEKLLSRVEGGDLAAQQLLEAEPNATLLFDTEAYAVEKEGNRISAVLTRHLITGAETRFQADQFIDATGGAFLAILADAETMEGCEPKSAFGESLAPDEPSPMHHGNTILFHTVVRDEPVDFPDVPWALDVARDYADLSGQMGAIGDENQPGPCACGHRGPVDFSPENIMNFPATHFWEYGQWLDLYDGNEEKVRDRLMRALYGTLANVRAADPERYAGLTFEWMHHVPARGEYKRIKGDWILTENEVRQHTPHEDDIVRNDSAFCLHYPGDEYDFRLGNWIWDMRDMQPYWIPFGCLYSCNVENLLMAGKHISVSRVVGSNVKQSANGAQHGIAVGAAAALCCKEGITPREVRESRMDELREAVAPYIGGRAPSPTPEQARAIIAKMQGKDPEATA